MNNTAIKLPRRKVRQTQVTPVGWDKLVSSWWGRSVGKLLLSAWLDIGSYKNNRKFTK